MSRPVTPVGLVRDACAGDQLAWDRLIALWLPDVLRWCALLGGPTVDPEDAAHDAFLVAMDKIDGLRDAEQFGPWMVGVTRRVLANHRRRAWYRRWVPGASVERASEGWPDATDAARLVRRALARLPERQRELVVLVDLEGWTPTEVSTALGLPLGTVKSRLGRGRKALRAALRRLDPSLPRLEVVEGGRR